MVASSEAPSQVGGRAASRSTIRVRVLVVTGKNPRRGREDSPGVLETQPLADYGLWNGTSETHHTPLTGPRASFHKVLSSPLVESTEETQRPHPAGRLAPRIRRPVIHTRVPISARGELCPKSTRLQTRCPFLRVPAALRLPVVQRRRGCADR